MSPTSGGDLMAQPLRGRTIVVMAGALAALQWTLIAQRLDTAAAVSSTAAAQSSARAAKRPLSYDVVDSWKAIQGTRLSDDGQWLAYATSAQGDDGELVVRNLRTGQEFKQPRGTAPTFTPDARFVVFTIAQPKAEEEKEAAANANASAEPGAEPAQGGQGRGRRTGRAREPRTGMGIMTLPDGQVKTFEKVGSFSLPETSSAWLAYHKGIGGGGGGGRGGGGRGGRGGGRGAGRGGGAAAAGRGASAGGAGQTAENGSREKRKDPGADLIIRNLVSGDEVTVG